MSLEKLKRKQYDANQKLVSSEKSCIRLEKAKNLWVPMSKAFVKEPENVEDDDEPQGSGLPAGSKNYITPAGARRLQEELHHLRTIERPHITELVAWAAELGDRSENADYHYNKKRLREIDRRIRFLSKRFDTIEIVPLRKDNPSQVFFGATVTVRDEENSLKTYTIVGIDETNLEKSRISWISPLGSALLKVQLGDFVTFHSPKGLREVEVVQILYQEVE